MKIMFTYIDCFILTAGELQVLLDHIWMNLTSVKAEIVKLVKEHKETTYTLLKLLVNIALIQGVITLFSIIAIRNGIAPASPPSVMIMGLEITPFLAVVITDMVEIGLKIIGYEELRKELGKWGNIGIGAIGGGMTGEIMVGAFIGASIGFGIWVIGEALGRKIEQTLA